MIREYQKPNVERDELIFKLIEAGFSAQKVAELIAGKYETITRQRVRILYQKARKRKGLDK